MECYLVGGAVRDRLLGLPVEENDWVIVGSSADELIAAGYTQIGSEFPVFLHPESREEYALARTERKTGAGHRGFEVNADEHVTLEQDLQRRDLTINAIAQRSNGSLADPCNGLPDLKQRVLRHISEAFREDPLRVLRVARFQAKLHHLGFTIAPETHRLLSEMSTSGELASLTPERVWMETEKALGTDSPDQYIKTLYQCDALKVVMPELHDCYHRKDSLWGDDANTRERIGLAINFASMRKLGAEIKYAILMHALGPISQPRNLEFSRPATTTNDENAILALGARLKAPNRFNELANIVGHYARFALQATQAKPDGILALLDRTDAWRRPKRFEDFLLSCEALTAGNSTLMSERIGSLSFLRSVLDACKAINAEEFVAAGVEGKAVGESVYNARKTLVASMKKQYSA